MGSKINEKIKKHKDYKEEVNRLDYTKDFLNKTINAVEEFKEVHKGNIRSIMSDEAEDSSDAYINLLITNNIIEMAEKNYYAYKKVKDKPYFSRIDFKIDDDSKDKDIDIEKKDEINKIYIGKASLYDAEKKEQIIVDWRAPVANVYYEGRLGHNTYKVGNETLSGEMYLKRQYTIEKGELTNFLDIDITTTDEFLQASLEANAEDKLKDIAATIQGEQNRVIRADLGRPLIVQGVAGSGKTTIALHRIAYFIYTYEDQFYPENYMILAPNRLFIDYISNVLPELGVERVLQTTYIDFVLDLIGKRYRVTDTDKKLTYLINGDDEEEKENIIWACKFKGSMEFKDIIDKYIKDIEKDFVPKEDFVVCGDVLLTYEEINRMFLEDLTYLPFYKRIRELKKSLRNKLNRIKDDIPRNIELSYDRALNKIRELNVPMEGKRPLLIQLMGERDSKLKGAKCEIKNAINDYLDKFPKENVFYYYTNLMRNAELINEYSDGNLNEDKLKYLCSKTTEMLYNKHIEFEDLAALLYLKHKVIGFDKKIIIKNVVIDEAQDFSIFQFYALKEVLNTNMFTILGDISQGIHSYRGIDDWGDMMKAVFEKDKPSYVTLEQSYRTTIEIMELANKVIQRLKNKNIILAKPVIRHGEKPEIKNYSDEKKLLEELSAKIKAVVNEDFKSIAVICKTEKECSNVKAYFDKNTDIKCEIIDGKKSLYNAGVVIVPCQLVKGLEFDAVFIVNIKEKYEDNPLDIKLLYVSMTRALHRLYIYKTEDGISRSMGLD